MLGRPHLPLLAPPLGGQPDIEGRLSRLTQRRQLLPVQDELYRPSVAQAEDKSLLGGPLESLAGEQEEPFHGLTVDSDMEPGLRLCLDAETV